MVVVEVKEGLTYYIDAKLKRNLDAIKKTVTQKDMDYVLVIDGYERCFSEATLIQTTDGNKSIKELVDVGIFVVNTIGLNLNNGKREINKSRIIPNSSKNSRKDIIIHFLEKMKNKNIIF